ncbi:MAG: 16S rRNA (uracil(1498)-N(3))-methyltransferase [Proteobacteria bacterium]|nr:16S rRNA (uracil(1498)-N(3))-methyltransferase [Pseudomonadota bacterium]MBS0463533.1 16S rRNA (uracil(1498)-N(3))-methyltransferase [Pseudomonadota bacterium]
MRIPRCFVEHSLAVGTQVALPPAACEHLLRVLRLPEGAALLLCNGDGVDYRAQLIDIGKRGAFAKIIEASPNAAQSPLRIVLAQALARGEKMDLVVQKATELGVTGIAPIVTERTEVRLDAERAQRRLVHWRGVAMAACEQCGRAHLPDIAEPMPLPAYLAGVGDPCLRLVLDPDGQPPSALLAGTPFDPARTPIHLVVGPEGGLSERDQAQLRAAGFAGLRLGPRILRTETAGLAALAAVQTLLGDWR